MIDIKEMISNLKLLIKKEPTVHQISKFTGLPQQEVFQLIIESLNLTQEKSGFSCMDDSDKEYIEYIKQQKPSKEESMRSYSDYLTCRQIEFYCNRYGLFGSPIFEPENLKKKFSIDDNGVILFDGKIQSSLLSPAGRIRQRNISSAWKRSLLVNEEKDESLAKMEELVHEYHKDQFIYNTIPLSEHVFSAASILKSAINHEKECSKEEANDLYLATLGQYLLEKTTLTATELLENTNANIVSIIEEISNPVNFLHHEYYNQLANASEKARLIKLAAAIDCLFNIYSKFDELGFNEVVGEYFHDLKLIIRSLEKTNFFQFERTAKFMMGEINTIYNLIKAKIENHIQRKSNTQSSPDNEKALNN